MPADAAADPAGVRPLFVFDAYFFAPRIRRILSLAGWRPKLGLPPPGAHVGVRGRGAAARRGEAVAARRNAALVRVEETALRPAASGRAPVPPLGLLIQRGDVPGDPGGASDLDHLLACHPLDDTALLDRARAAIRRLRAAELSGCNAFDPWRDPPAPGYVLVLDEPREDGPSAVSGGGPGTFREMLALARIEHPGARILIKSHDGTADSTGKCHFGPGDEDARTRIHSDPVSPWALLEGAIGVYTVSAPLGFEAILAGHRPRVFGQPFYAGWGLTSDERPPPRPGRSLTRAQLAACALILAPTWYDPCRDRLCSPEDAIDHLEASVRAFREDRRGYVATALRRHQRRSVRRFFGAGRPTVFDDRPERAAARAARRGLPLIVWADRAVERLEAATARTGTPLVRVGEGFLRRRSREGREAARVPPLSLIADDLGICHDPGRESRLERLVAEASTLDREQLHKAERLIARLRATGVTACRSGARRLPDLPEGQRILVAGQIEGGASSEAGCTGPVRTNRALLAKVRAARPDAILLFLPHPDIEPGRLSGAPAEAEVAGLADAVLSGVDAAAALAACHEVWTLTSVLGFDALVRGHPVTCLGAPFYAGWGLTNDLAPVPARRAAARPGLAALVHAALIAYPRYLDPVSGLPCPVEVALDRIEAGPTPRRGAGGRALATAQGWLAGRGRHRR